MSYQSLEQLKEQWWQEVIQDVTFYSEEGNIKIEEISGRDFNQFESLCDLYAEGLQKRWGVKVKWKLENVS